MAWVVTNENCDQCDKVSIKPLRGIQEYFTCKYVPNEEGQRESYCHEVESMVMKDICDMKFASSRLKEKLAGTLLVSLDSDTLYILDSAGKGCLITCGDVELNPGPGRLGLFINELYLTISFSESMIKKQVTMKILRLQMLNYLKIY